MATQPPQIFFATNNNVIDVLVPVGASTGTIRIDTPALNPAITSSNFIVQPTISGFSPNFGQSGTAVTVTGANLNVGTPAVRFGTALSANVSNITFSNLVAVVPPGAVTAAITISNAHGTNMSSQLFYMPPRIDSFTPSNAPAGTRIKIVGTNLLGTSAISFNGTPAPEFTVTNNGVIGVDVPAGAISGPIFITTPHSTTNSGINWFFATPVITGFNPSHGLPGTNVTILGTNFAGVSSVQFNGSNAAFNLGTNGVLTAIVPTNATTGFVSVTTPAGTATSGVPFTLDYASDLRVTVSAPASAVLGSDYTYVHRGNKPRAGAAANVMFTNQLPGNVAYKFGSTSKGGPVIAQRRHGARCTGNSECRHKGDHYAHSNRSGEREQPRISRGRLVMIPIRIRLITRSPQTRSFTSCRCWACMQLSETQLRLSWSVALADFILESTGNLALTSSWLEVLTEPEYIGDQKTVTETIGPESRFYRLRRN